MIIVFKLFLVVGVLMAVKEDADDFIEYLRREAGKK